MKNHNALWLHATLITNISLFLVTVTESKVILFRKCTSIPHKVKSTWILRRDIYKNLLFISRGFPTDAGCTIK